MDGNSPSELQSVSIGTDGTLSYVYANGKTVPAYKIPLGNVVSPDSLTNITGNVFQVNTQSGSLVIGNAGNGGLGNHPILGTRNLDGGFGHATHQHGCRAKRLWSQ